MHSKLIPGAAVLSILLGSSALAQERWDKDIGKPAPRLYPAGWVGTPVSLDALKKGDDGSGGAAAGETVAKKASTGGGNTVVLAFWNADIPC